MPRADYQRCPNCGGDMRPGEYLCDRCLRMMPHDVTPMRLLADRPEWEQKNGCATCPMVHRCEDRIRANLWMLCEIPSEEDVAIARSAGVLDEAALHRSIGSCATDRSVIQLAVSHS